MTIEPSKEDRSQPGVADPEPPRCGNCNGVISQEDVICPHCGVSLAGG